MTDEQIKEILYSGGTGVSEKQFTNISLHRAAELRRHALATIELAKGFTPERRLLLGNTFKVMEEMAGCVLMLTNLVDLHKVEKGNN